MISTLDLPDQTDRTWLITGGTSGIGRELTLAVVRAGGRVILPARRAERAAQVTSEAVGARGVVVPWGLDLADLRSVRRFARRFDEPVDVLVNNAGGVSARRRETADGFEQLLGTNFLGPFALTNLIAPLVRDRIVITGSDAHRVGQISFADPHFRSRRWSAKSAYAQSKLCTMLWARALHNRVSASALHRDASGASTTFSIAGHTPDTADDAAPVTTLAPLSVITAHPGWAFTGIHKVTGARALDWLIGVGTKPFAQSAAAGALPLAEAALGEHPSLSYIGPDGRNHMRGNPTPQPVAARATDDLLAEAVWRFAAAETGTDLV